MYFYHFCKINTFLIKFLFKENHFLFKEINFYKKKFQKLGDFVSFEYI